MSQAAPAVMEPLFQDTARPLPCASTFHPSAGSYKGLGIAPDFAFAFAQAAAVVSGEATSISLAPAFTSTSIQQLLKRLSGTLPRLLQGDIGSATIINSRYLGLSAIALPFSLYTHDMHLNLSLPMLHPYYCRAVPYELQARAVAPVHNVKLDHNACSSHITAYVGVCHDTIVLTQCHNHHSNARTCNSVFESSDKCNGSVMFAAETAGGVASHAAVKARLLDAGGPEAYTEFVSQCMLAHVCSHCLSAHTHMTCTCICHCRCYIVHVYLPNGLMA